MKFILFGKLSLFAALVVMFCNGASQAWGAEEATNTELTIASGGNTVASGGSVASGSEVTLTAAVTAGSTQVTTGQVNFCDASTAHCTDIHLLGTAQLTSAGTAVFRFVPGIGSHSYKAVFVGTPNRAAAYAGSTSAPAALTVTGTFPTTTAIASSGSVGNYTLTATVTGSVNSPSVAAPASSINFVDTSSSNTVLATANLGGAVYATGLVNVDNPQTGNEPGAVVVGDFNGDGIPDLAVALNETSQSVGILLGDGTGNFTPVTKSPITAAGSPIVVQDLNGDGIPDIVLSSASDDSLTVLLGNGDGTFKVAPGSPTSTNYGAYPIVVADVNGDGIPDLVAGGGYYLVTLLGNGDGSFTEMPITASTYSEATFSSMVVGDFNGDGIPDLATLDLAGQHIVILFGNGDGTFKTGPTTTTSTMSAGSPLSLTAGDFNGDGKLDLAVPIYGSSGSLAVLLGNGDGTFQAAPGSPVSVEDWPSMVYVGDFNGDGIADILVAAQTSGTTINILLGKGDGTFSQMQTGSPQLECCSNTALGDFNGDGVTDIVSSSFYNGNAEVLLTQLTQTTTATTTGISPVGTGTHQVDASYLGNSVYSASVSSTVGLTAVTPPSFAIAGTGVTVTAGATTGNTSTITITPAGGFTGSVALTAALTSSPNNAVDAPTFTFGATTPVSITGVAAGTATLTIATTARATGSGSCTASNSTPRNIPWYAGGGAVLACVFLLGIPARRRRLRNVIGMLAMLVAIAGGLLACGGSSGGGCTVPVSPFTTPGNYTITVTGTSGTLTEAGTVSLTVQ